MILIVSAKDLSVVSRIMKKMMAKKACRTPTPHRLDPVMASCMLKYINLSS